MAHPNAGDDSNPRSGEGGPRHTPAALAADPAFTGTYAPIRSASRYVASTGVTSNDTANIQAAHDALPSTGGTIFLDSGPYVITGGSINFTKPVAVVGLGPSAGNAIANGSFLNTGTKITTATNNAAIFTVNADGCRFERLSFAYTGGAGALSGSAGIQVASNGRSGRVIDCDFTSFYANLDIVAAYEWYIDRCHFFDPVQYGIQVQDTGNADAGDGIVSNCFIYAGPNNLTPQAGIQWRTGGGLKVTGTKINGRGTGKFSVGVDYKIGDGKSTSVGIINACSIENTAYGVIVELDTGATGTFGKVTITGNEFLCTSYGVAVSPSATGKITGVHISGNVGGGGTALILARNADRVELGVNTIYTGTLTSFGVGLTNLYFNGISFTTAARPAATACRAGTSYFDTTLGKPGFSTGSAWVDATGTTI